VPAGGNYFATDSGVVTTAVPEPATLTLLGLGMASMIGRARRKRTRCAPQILHPSRSVPAPSVFCEGPVEQAGADPYWAEPTPVAEG